MFRFEKRSRTSAFAQLDPASEIRDGTRELRRMIKLFNKGTGEFIGRISQADLDFLAAQLEEESLGDTDYYIRTETLEQFDEQGASAHLLEVLRGGIRGDPAIEIRWEADKQRPKA